MNLESGTTDRLTVLITSPSLNEDENVSGISGMAREIIRHCNCDFVTFAAGKKDAEKSGALWLLRQLILPFAFFWKITSKRVDLVHINTALAPLAIIRDFTLVFIGRLFGYPVLIHVHGGKFMLREFESGMLNRIAGEMLYMADTVLVLNRAEKALLRGRWNGLRPHILPNAVDLKRIGFKSHPNAVKEIVFLGRIDRAKGLDEIRRACGAVKRMGFEFRFKCYGAGPYRNQFTSEMNETLNGWFNYGGILKGSEKWAALAEADILLLPSYYEGLPLSILEAMAAKCIVVASKVGSIGDVIEDGVNGFLVEPHNSEQIVDKLVLLLTDKVDWKSIGDRARSTIVESFAIEDYIGKLEEQYRSTVTPLIR